MAIHPEFLNTGIILLPLILCTFLQMAPHHILVTRLSGNDNIPYQLLLLADPSRELIDEYLKNSLVFIASLNSEPIGIYVLYPLPGERAEIKNIAVAKEHQGKGIGKLLLAHASQTAKQNGFRFICIGTADSSIAQIALYQKQGFSPAGIKKEFFLNNYPEPVSENGRQAIDMLMFEKKL